MKRPLVVGIEHIEELVVNSRKSLDETLPELMQAGCIEMVGWFLLDVCTG